MRASLVWRDGGRAEVRLTPSWWARLWGAREAIVELVRVPTALGGGLQWVTEATRSHPGHDVLAALDRVEVRALPAARVRAGGDAPMDLALPRCVGGEHVVELGADRCDCGEHPAGRLMGFGAPPVTTSVVDGMPPGYCPGPSDHVFDAGATRCRCGTEDGQRPRGSGERWRIDGRPPPTRVPGPGVWRLR